MKGYGALCFAWCVACLGVCCSIYISEGLNLGNCTLCWIQRMCMYPLAVILGMAVYNASYSVITYVIPQVCFGCCAACYQIALQSGILPDFLSLCEGGPSCLDSINIGLGFISLPMLSACGFYCILGSLCYCLKQVGDSQLVYIKIK